MSREETWEGGYIRRDAQGKATYYIYKKVQGTLYERSTRCHNLKAAMQHLTRFEADPANYSPNNEKPKGPEPIFLDSAFGGGTIPLKDEYLSWSEARNSAIWYSKQKRYVAWWAEQLAGKNLRTVTLAGDILPALGGQKARAHRIAVLKAFFSWLRTERHILDPREDPTLGALKAPPPKAAQQTKTKVVPREDFRKVVAALGDSWKPALILQGGTGWHVSEVERFCTGGSIEAYRGEQETVAGVLVCPEAKVGGVLRTPVSADVLEAAKKLIGRGSFSAQKYGMAVKAACREAGVNSFTPGMMRHSVATWAVEAGASLGDVATFLNHKSATTTKKFYSTLAVPAKVPTLI